LILKSWRGGGKDVEYQCFKEGESSSDYNREFIHLGNTNISVSPIAIGTFSWGDHIIWDYGRTYDEEQLHYAFDTAIAEGITFFDTAEVYGWGRSERILGNFITASTHGIVVSTKFFPYPWRLRKKSLMGALHKSLNRLKVNHVDLYQVHNPYPPLSLEIWLEAMIEALEAGLIRAIGISNCNLEQTMRAYDFLRDYGIHLTSNQVEFNLLNHHPEQSGLLQECRENNISLIAYCPLAMGMLTGKYTSNNPPSHRFTFYKRLALKAYTIALPDITAPHFCQYDSQEISHLQPLLHLLQKIGTAHEKKPAQVALNWIIQKGAIPVVGVRNAHQAQENTRSFGWKLTGTEIDDLDELSSNFLLKRNKTADIR
jgi:aryl-alcohol dehydrogenase-like predicted oxidoreductase